MQTTLLINLEMITKTVNEECPFDIKCFDFSKEFDTITLHILQHKLMSLGIIKKTMLWINDFLSEQMQRVVINKLQ